MFFLSSWIIFALPDVTQCTPVCPRVECSSYVSPTRWTGRVAIIVTGFIRTMTSTAGQLKQIKELNRETSVEVYYHVWYNESARCDTMALESVASWSDGVTFEPTSCAWSWGKQGFKNHWHGVSNAFRALSLVFGKNPRDYGLIMRTGTDVTYRGLDFFDFSRIWDTFSVYHQHFILVGYANGLDRHAIGTPDLMHAYSVYTDNEGFGCDGQSDAFPAQRMRRYGVTIMPNWTDIPSFMRPVTEHPRCGVLLVTKRGIFRGGLLRPSPTLGCREHSPVRRTRRQLTSTTTTTESRRRLAIRPPKSLVRAEHSFCSRHQFEVFSVNNATSPKNPP